jgi:hypothetical protein
VSAGGVRFAVADLLQAPVMAHGRNRERVAEAAGLRTHELPRLGPVSPPARELSGSGAGAGPSSRGEEGGLRSDQARPRRGGAAESISAGCGAGCSDLSPGDAAPPVADLRALTLAVLGEERRGPYLEGEDATQSDVRWFVDQGTRAGKWAIVLVAIYNEVRVRSASKAELARRPELRPWHERQQRLAQVEGARTRMMGRRKGAPDCLAINVGLEPVRFGLIEVKFPPNKLSDEQETWRDWCDAAGVDWALATHPTHREDVLRAFRAWGWITP